MIPQQSPQSPRKPGNFYKANGLNRQDERVQIAQRALGRQERNAGYATKRVVDGSDPNALMTDAPIIVLFFWRTCPYCLKYKPMWNAVASVHNAHGNRCPIPMIAVDKEAMSKIVKGTNPGLIGGYVKEFPTVRIIKGGVLLDGVNELPHPVRPSDEGVNPADRLRQFVTDACSRMENVDPGFTPPTLLK